MGGIGSGRARQRVHLEELPRLSASVLRGGLGHVATMRWSNGWVATVHMAAVDLTRVRVQMGKRAFEEDIAVENDRSTIPRYWFRCPACWRRCRILYLVPATVQLVCRQCGGAIYRSQSKSATERLLLTYNRIRARLEPGSEQWDLSAFPEKPPGMWRSTYRRLEQRGDELMARFDRQLLRSMLFGMGSGRRG
jgi:hypothetical protein